MLIEATWEKGAGGVRIGTQECQEWTHFGKLANTGEKRGHYIMEQADNHNTNSFQRRKIHAARFFSWKRVIDKGIRRTYWPRNMVTAVHF